MRKHEKTTRPTFPLAEELAMVDRLAAYALSIRDSESPWERSATSYALVQLALDMTQALRDPAMGPHLSVDLEGIDPHMAAPQYCQMYAEAWLEDAEDLISVAIARLQAIVAPATIVDAVRVVAGKPVRVSEMIGREISAHGYVSPVRERCVRLSWRIWQMRVRSGEMIAEREWRAFLDAAFASMDSERIGRVVKRLVEDEFPPSARQKEQ